MTDVDTCQYITVATHVVGVVVDVRCWDWMSNVDTCQYLTVATHVVGVVVDVRC